MILGRAFHLARPFLLTAHRNADTIDGMTTIIVTVTPQGLFQAIGTSQSGERVCKYEANRAQGIQDILERYHEGAAVEWRVDQR